MKPHLFRRLAFTLVELMVVIAMLALLALTLRPALAGTRQRNNRIGCLNNLRQMAAGSQMYADDDSKHCLTGPCWWWPEAGKTPTAADIQSSDDLSWLYPHYIPDVKSFICPSTHNFIQNSNLSDFNAQGIIYDLITKAGGKLTGSPPEPLYSNDLHGHSYEQFSCWYDSPTFTRKTTRTVLSYRNKVRPDPGGPAGVFLIIDQMEPHASQTLSWPYQNFPNPYNNHGQAGGHVAFADGHAAWVPVERWKDAITRSDDYPLLWQFPPGY